MRTLYLISSFHSLSVTFVERKCIATFRTIMDIEFSKFFGFNIIVGGNLCAYPKGKEKDSKYKKSFNYATHIILLFVIGYANAYPILFDISYIELLFAWYYTFIVCVHIFFYTILIC